MVLLSVRARGEEDGCVWEEREELFLADCFDFFEDALLEEILFC